MSDYAFEDIERKIKIYAKAASKNNINKLYYCPTPHCGAHLYLCSLNGLTSPYFRATKKAFPHTDSCFYKRNINSNYEHLKETEFDFDDIVNNLLATTNQKISSVKFKKSSDNLTTNESKKERISTLKQLYCFLKSKDVQEKYNQSTIGFMLLDDRSLFMNSKGVFGNKIIEAQVYHGKFYDNEKQEIKFKMPNNDTYTFILDFPNEETFKNIRDIIYNNRNEIFVLAGYWNKKSFNHFYSEYKNKKQIYILR